MQTLAGRTAVFAGATGGDGRDSVKALCAGGMNVAIMTHNAPEAERLIAEVKAADLPGGCIYFSGGSGQAAAEENAAVYAEVFKRFGSLDVVISNTGANGHIDSIESLTAQELLKSLDHLAVGAFKMLQTALPYSEAEPGAPGHLHDHCGRRLWRDSREPRKCGGERGGEVAGAECRLKAGTAWYQCKLHCKRGNHPGGWGGSGYPRPG